jgi:hypothetical protein
MLNTKIQRPAAVKVIVEYTDGESTTILAHSIEIARAIAFEEARWEGTKRAMVPAIALTVDGTFAAI